MAYLGTAGAVLTVIPLQYPSLAVCDSCRATLNKFYLVSWATTCYTYSRVNSAVGEETSWLWEGVTVRIPRAVSWCSWTLESSRQECLVKNFRKRIVKVQKQREITVSCSLANAQPAGLSFHIYSMLSQKHLCSCGASWSCFMSLVLIL